MVIELSLFDLVIVTCLKNNLLFPQLENNSICKGLANGLSSRSVSRAAGKWPRGTGGCSVQWGQPCATRSRVRAGSCTHWSLTLSVYLLMSQEPRSPLVFSRKSSPAMRQRPQFLVLPTVLCPWISDCSCLESIYFHACHPTRPQGTLGWRLCDSFLFFKD